MTRKIFHTNISRTLTTSLLLVSITAYAGSEDPAKDELLNALSDEANVTDLNRDKTAETNNVNVEPSIAPGESDNVNDLAKKVGKTLETLLKPSSKPELPEGTKTDTAELLNLQQQLENVVTDSLSEGKNFDDIKSAVSTALTDIKENKDFKFDPKLLSEAESTLNELIKETPAAAPQEDITVKIPNTQSTLSIADTVKAAMKENKDAGESAESSEAKQTELSESDTTPNTDTDKKSSKSEEKPVEQATSVTDTQEAILQDNTTVVEKQAATAQEAQNKLVATETPDNQAIDIEKLTEEFNNLTRTNQQKLSSTPPKTTIEPVAPLSTTANNNTTDSPENITTVTTSTTMGTTEVLAGESLYKISLRVYGSGRHYLRLFKANEEQLKGNPDHIRPGMTLTVPELP